MNGEERGNGGPFATRVCTVEEQMAIYDELAPAFRRFLSDAPINVDARDVARYVEGYGEQFTEREMLIALWEAAIRQSMAEQERLYECPA